jgi:Icc-related predicted phosphoesterase
MNNKIVLYAPLGFQLLQQRLVSIPTFLFNGWLGGHLVANVRWYRFHKLFLTFNQNIMNYENLSDEEIKKTVKGIIQKANSEEEIKEQVKNILGYPYEVAVSMTKSELWKMKMAMVMMHNKDGKILNI